jgi:hypothetical protein
MMSGEVFWWWFFLCAVSVLNLLAWFTSAVALKRRQRHLSPKLYASRRLLLGLSAAYALGCAYRSVLPIYDGPRICMIDSWLSSVMVGRSVATLAELCFAAQWVVILREISFETDSRFGHTVAWTIVPLIAVAEVCSWYSVLTTSNLGHVAEESIWGLCATLLVLSLFEMWPRCDSDLRRLLAIWCVVGIAYVAFMFFVDVPMYWSRWLVDESGGRQYLSLSQGLIDVSERWIVSHRWDIWKDEVVWMSMYFSIAVWISIALVHVPASTRRRNT